MCSGEPTELVNEEEMKCLLAHHTCEVPLVGFACGERNKVTLFPGACAECQEKEVKAYERRLRSEHRQYVLLPKTNEEPTIAQERELLLFGGRSMRADGE